MTLDQIANYFNDIPLYGLNGESWDDLRMVGLVSQFIGGLTEAGADTGARKLLAPFETPIPSNYTVIRLGSEGSIYLLATHGEAIGSPGHYYSFSYLIHKATDQVQIKRKTTTTKASGVAAAVTWSTVATVYASIMYAAWQQVKNNQLNRVDTVDYVIAFPSDTDVRAEDEVHTVKNLYTVTQVYTLNELNMAVCLSKPKL
jgi:hypothetical protein